MVFVSISKPIDFNSFVFYFGELPHNSHVALVVALFISSVMIILSSAFPYYAILTTLTVGFSLSINFRACIKRTVVVVFL
jgi:hypothetical protein